MADARRRMLQVHVHCPGAVIESVGFFFAFLSGFGGSTAKMAGLIRNAIPVIASGICKR